MPSRITGTDLRGIHHVCGDAFFVDEFLNLYSANRVRAVSGSQFSGQWKSLLDRGIDPADKPTKSSSFFARSETKGATTGGMFSDAGAMVDIWGRGGSKRVERRADGGFYLLREGLKKQTTPSLNSESCGGVEGEKESEVWWMKLGKYTAMEVRLSSESGEFSKVEGGGEV